jgi:hypothetical protein
LVLVVTQGFAVEHIGNEPEAMGWRLAQSLRT